MDSDLPDVLENVPDVKRRSRPVTLTSQVAKERFRASIMASGDNADVDLDAILGELCELETQLTTTQDELTTLQTKDAPTSPPTGHTAPPTGNKAQPGGSTDDFDGIGIDSQLQDALSELSDFISGDLNNLGSSTEPTPVKPKKPKPPISRPPPIDTIDSGHVSDLQCNDRTMESPEVPAATVRPMETSGRDSGISESVSIPSSSSHMSVNTNTSGVASSCGSGDTPNSPKEVLQAHLNDFQTQLETLTPDEQKVRLKQEKLRLALEKLEQTNLDKLLVKAFSPDGSCKTIFVGENMTVLDVTQVLAVKNHMKLNPDLAVVEILTDLCMERIFEDHECLVENLLFWPKETNNKVMFVPRPERYHFFTHPECYLPLEDGKLSHHVSDAQRSQMLDKFFDGITTVPKMEGVLQMKAEGKKTWKKYYFALRASGLCYSPKSKGKPTSDVTCLQKLDMVEVYYGIDWKKKYKAPSDYGFALKHPQIQQKAPKYIHYLCGENEAVVQKWVNAIRVLKSGRELLENYQLVRDISEHWDGSELVPGIAQAPKPVEKIQNGGHSVQKVDLNANEKSHSPNHTPNRGHSKVETVAIRTGSVHKEPKHSYEEQDTEFIASTPKTTGGAYIPVSTSTLKHIAGHSGTLNRSPEKKISPERRLTERKASTPERKLTSPDHSGPSLERRAPPPVNERRAPPLVAEKRVPSQVVEKKAPPPVAEKKPPPVAERKAPPVAEKKPQVVEKRAPPVAKKTVRTSQGNTLPPAPPDPEGGKLAPPPPSSFPPPPSPGTLRQSVTDTQSPPQENGTYFAVVQDNPPPLPARQSSGTYFAVVAGDSPSEPATRGVHNLPSPGLPPPPPPFEEEPLPPPPRADYMPPPPSGYQAPGAPRRPPPGAVGFNPQRMPVLPPVPRMAGARPKSRPPPPKRSDHMKVHMPMGDHDHFASDLNRVLECKTHHSSQLKDSSYHQAPMWTMPDHLDYLPPPPPELLEGLESHQPSKPKPKPPPPKRSENTRLSTHR